MNFSTAEKVQAVREAMIAADKYSRDNRTKINRLFNGEQPWEVGTAEEIHAETNVNFMEAPNIAAAARRQLDNASKKAGNFFTVRLDRGPAHYRSGWGRYITKCINRIMKDSIAYDGEIDSTNAQLVLHGVAPGNWDNQDRWYPEAVGIEEILVPRKTKVSLSNLDHFFLLHKYTAGQLFRMTHGKSVDPAWNMPMVNRILSKIKDDNLKSTPVDSKNPEELAERYRENGGYLETDAVPTIDCGDFYYRAEDDSDGKWKRLMVATGGQDDNEQKEFIYQPKDRFYADRLEEIIHFQFANGANISPFRVHSVRSLGHLLFGVCHLQNKLRCRFADSTFEQMLWFFRNVGADDRERVEKIDLHHMGIIPEGVNFVPASERFQVDVNIINAALTQNRQLMSESSSAFVQDVDFGDQASNETATLTMAKMNTSNALISSMLTRWYRYKTVEYKEICRRFCRKNSNDKDVQKFRQRCLQEGIPEQALDVEYWIIEPERVMGGGNKILEIAQADKLMAARNLYDGDAQREILHIYTEANTDDPQLAERLVPPQKQEVSDSAHDANLASGALMAGLPVGIKQGINHIDYVEEMLKTMDGVIQRIEANGAMATKEEVIGLGNMAQHVEQHIAIIAQDKNEGERVKQYGDALGQMTNMIKAYAQRLQEQQQQAGPEITPEAQAKIASSTILAQSAAKIKEAGAAQKMQHKQIAFATDQQRKEQEHQIEMRRTLEEQQVDNAAVDLKTAADIRRPKKEAA